ncbi:MAG: MFS transporter [Dysgonamonadaceae bacterium]|jgi:FHS family L-fucose permease-like MFS transporter|nr:MFS transporter [Dysgonamonadaceae bacterium]
MVQKKQSGNIVAIIAMFFLFAMISFVTNLAAPIGVIWKESPGIDGSNFLGMMGNMMNFLAYLFMGIPAGKLLTRIGYKKTALAAIAVGLAGVFVQFLSGSVGVGATIFNLPANWYIYLLGAFISGFSVCMLNTVVNPMLNLLGGGGKKGLQLLNIGGSCNSLAATLTPMFVGSLIGQVTKETAINNVNPVLYIAMGVFAAAFAILFFTPIADPEQSRTGANVKFENSAWSFRHLVLGAIGIFVYVGIEIGIPGTLNFFLADNSANGGGLDPATATSIAGFVAGTYWFMMLIGRLAGGFIFGKFSSKAQLSSVSIIGIIFVLLFIFLPAGIKTYMPVFKGAEGFGVEQVPLGALFLVLCGLCTSVMWGGIFNLATEGLGKYIPQGSGIFMMMVVGGGILPLIQNKIADLVNYRTSYLVVIAGLVYLLYYALYGSRNVNKDIPVD